MTEFEKQIEEQCAGHPHTYKMGYLQGYLKGIEFARNEVNKIKT